MSTGLRVCMVTTFYPPCSFGGDGIAVQRLARALSRQGHDVTVLCNTDAFTTLGGVAQSRDDDQEDGVHVHRIATRSPMLSSLITQQTGRPMTSMRAIRRVLAPGRFDVIHFHNVSLVGGPAILGEGDGIKLYTAHEHWLVCPTHVLWRYKVEPCPARDCFRCQLAYRRPPQLWRYTGYLERQLAHVNVFIACSEFSRAKHHEFGFPREMAVVPPLLEDAPYEVPDTGSPHARPYFLFVGRLERIKGLDDVIPLMRDYPEADLLVVGDGEHRADLERIAAGSERIRFIGRVASNDLGRYYAHAIAVLVPTVGFETFGFVAVEALRQGTPVIARKRGPLVEIVESSRGGELFETPGELRDAMQRMQRDPARRDAIGRAARASFAERWSERVVLPRYLALLEQAARDLGAHRVIEALSAGRAA
jgi:glycosyltransferase involved in cell wall biosynthesis